MKYVVLSTDGYGPKLYTNHEEARSQALYYLYLCSERSHVDLISVGEDTVSKQSFYWDDHYEESEKVYRSMEG